MLDGVHLGVGDGTFRAPLAGLGLPAGDAYGPAVAGRFQRRRQARPRDRRLDSNNTVLLVLGNGDGTFQTGT